MLHKRIAVVAVLVSVTLAHADIRVFMTNSAEGYGLDLIGPDGDGTGTDPEHDDWPIDPFRPTYSTVDLDGSNHYAFDYYYGYYRAAAYPPIDAPSGTIDNPILIDAGAGDWGYIWFQFRQEPFHAYLNFLQIVISEAGSTEPTSNVLPSYYVQNDVHAYGQKRWDGWAFPDDDYANWHENPQTVLSISAQGISNTGDDPVNMFKNQSIEPDLRTGVALLGAVQGSASDTVYELWLYDWTYGSYPYPEAGESCYFQFVPEPGSGMLLAMTGALLVRRGRANWVR